MVAGSRRRGSRGSSDVIAVFVVMTVVSALGTGLALVASSAVDDESRATSRERAEKNARFGLELARERFKPWVESKLRDALEYAASPESTWDLTTPFLEEVSIDDHVLEATDVPGADKEHGVDVVEARTRFWLTAPPVHPSFDAIARRGGGAGSDGNHADLYTFAYRTEAVGRSAHDAEVQLAEEGVIPVAILVDMTIGDAFAKGAASSGGFDGMGDFSTLAATPFTIEPLPNDEDRFGPPVFVGQPEELGGVTLPKPGGGVQKYGQKIYIYTVRGLAEPPGTRRGALGGIQVLASFNGKRLQSHILYQDAWRRSPDYDPDRDALKVVHEDGSVEYWKGPDGKIAVVGPSTTDFYEVVETRPEGVYVRKKPIDSSAELEVELLVPALSPIPVRAPVVMGDDSKPVRKNLTDFDSAIFTYNDWAVVYYGTLVNSPNSGKSQFTGRVAFVLDEVNSSPPAQGTSRSGATPSLRPLRIANISSTRPGIAVIQPYNTGLGETDDSTSVQIDTAWNVQGSLSGNHNAWYPISKLVTLQHLVQYNIEYQDEASGAWLVQQANVEYNFSNAMIEGSLSALPTVTPPGRHLTIWATAVSVIPLTIFRSAEK